MKSEADSAEKGGKHYKDVPPEMQHWNVVAALGWDYYVGSATKYLWRLGKKDDPVKELEKAIHFLQKKRELILNERLEIERRNAQAEIDQRTLLKEEDGIVRVTSPAAELALEISKGLRAVGSFYGKDDGKHF